jgi:hypothetical protein
MIFKSESGFYPEQKLKNLRSFKNNL